MITSRQVQINEYLGDKCNMVIPYNKLLTHVDNEQFAWKTLLNELDHWNKSWDEISLSSLPEKSIGYIPNITQQLKSYTDKACVKWILPLNKKCGDRDELYSKFSGKFRHTLRHSLKALEKEYGKINITLANSTDQALDYFEKMKSLHTTRWEKEGRAGSFANEKWVEFHKNIIKNGFPRNEVYIVEIFTSKLKLGYIYGHLYDGIAYMHQTGFKVTENNNLRPGYISHFESMHLLALSGLKYYDLLPDEKNSYKKHLTHASSKIYWIRLQRPKLKFFIEEKLRQALKTKFIHLLFNKQIKMGS